MTRQFDALPSTVGNEWNDRQVIRVVNLGGELLSSAAGKSFANRSHAARQTLRDGLYYERQFINSEGNPDVRSQPDIAPLIDHFGRLALEANVRDQLLETHLGRMDLFRRAIQGEHVSTELYKAVLTKFSVSVYPDLDSLPSEAIGLEEKNQAEISGRYATGINSPIELLEFNHEEAIKRLLAKRLLKLPSEFDAEKRVDQARPSRLSQAGMVSLLGIGALATAVTFDFPPGIRENFLLLTQQFRP